MPIDVRCPGCGQKYRVPESTAGKRVRCQSAGCGAQISVPAIVADEDDFAGNLDEAAADFGEPLPPPVPARTPRKTPEPSEQKTPARREKKAPVPRRPVETTWFAYASVSARKSVPERQLKAGRHSLPYG